MNVRMSICLTPLSAANKQAIILSTQIDRDAQSARKWAGGPLCSSAATSQRERQIKSGFVSIYQPKSVVPVVLWLPRGICVVPMTGPENGRAYVLRTGRVSSWFTINTLELNQSACRKQIRIERGRVLVQGGFGLNVLILHICRYRCQTAVRYIVDI